MTRFTKEQRLQTIKNVIEFTITKRRKIILNHKTIYNLMKEKGLKYKFRKKKYRSYKGNTGKVAYNLLNRNFDAEEQPNVK